MENCVSEIEISGIQGSEQDKRCSASAHVAVQDALVGATDKKNSQHEKDGELFYDYEVTGAVSMRHATYLPLLALGLASCWP